MSVAVRHAGHSWCRRNASLVIPGTSRRVTPAAAADGSTPPPPPPPPLCLRRSVELPGPLPSAAPAPTALQDPPPALASSVTPRMTWWAATHTSSSSPPPLRGHSGALLPRSVASAAQSFFAAVAAKAGPAGAGPVPAAVGPTEREERRSTNLAPGSGQAAAMREPPSNGLGAVSCFRCCCRWRRWRSIAPGTACAKRSNGRLVGKK